MTNTPERIGRYQIERVLGRGAMGVIYKAHDPAIDRPVAIKLVRADLLDGTERDEYLARFRQEAQAVGRCTHPNIVALYDYAIHEGNPFLAMEYVEGVSLAQALERGTRFRPDEASFIVLQVLEGLGCAHELGVVHRDVKPANVLMLPGGRVKVTDFGISRIGGSTLTQAGSVIGTPSYMSPEQCRGDAVDHRGDLFSAGVVLFELLTGEKPFSGRTFTEAVKQLLYDEAPDLRGRVPDPLAAVVRRALAKRPQDRFSSARAMADALRAAGLAAAPETTVVQARPSAPGGVSSTGLGGVREEVLTTLQRRLARHVGPIAKVLLGSAVQRAASVEALCELLAANIASPQERQDFLRGARRDCGAQIFDAPTQGARRTGTVGGGTDARGHGPAGPSPAPAIPPATVELAHAELARLIGPIARVLVKRALATAATPAELWDALAAHIERPSDRAAFLKRRPRP
ncbi:MAG: serine/threonine protein kinase [Acetobacteraceae bacterium]|nr:serine/threonine protein kinase [Acetobacteraceae bacterium]